MCLILGGGQHRGEEGWEGTAHSKKGVQDDGAYDERYKGEGSKEGSGGNNGR